VRPCSTSNVAGVVSRWWRASHRTRSAIRLSERKNASLHVPTRTAAAFGAERGGLGSKYAERADCHRLSDSATSGTANSLIPFGCRVNRVPSGPCATRHSLYAPRPLTDAATARQPDATPTAGISADAGVRRVLLPGAGSGGSRRLQHGGVSTRRARGARCIVGSRSAISPKRQICDPLPVDGHPENDASATRRRRTRRPRRRGRSG